MKGLPQLLLWTAAAVCLSGCFSLTDTQTSAPALPVTASLEQAAEQKKQSLATLKPSAVSLPEALGGILSSDRWTVYQEKEEEEFEGNVHYDNGQYIFRAGYALSQRKQNLFTAREKVYLRRNEPDGVWYELHAPQAVYNYKTGWGQAEAPSGQQIKLVYHTAKGDLITAYARRAEFNTKQQTYVLAGRARVLHQNAQGQLTTLKADRISVKQKTRYALLKGHASADNDTYHFQSDAIEYDGIAQQAYAYGDRPLAQGSTPDGTFAIIADKVTAQTDSRKIHLEGDVQGWVVSQQINQSKANKKL